MSYWESSLGASETHSRLSDGVSTLCRLDRTLNFLYQGNSEMGATIDLQLFFRADFLHYQGLPESWTSNKLCPSLVSESPFGWFCFLQHMKTKCGCLFDIGCLLERHQKVTGREVPAYTLPVTFLISVLENRCLVLRSNPEEQRQDRNILWCRECPRVSSTPSP